MLRSACAHTLPPRPPSPPFGPPKGMNFSRRKLTQPAPPCPAATSIVASSTNFMDGRWYAKAQNESPGGPGLRGRGRGAPSGRDDADRVAVLRALDGERHLAVDQGEQRVITPDTDVVAGV